MTNFVDLKHRFAPKKRENFKINPRKEKIKKDYDDTLIKRLCNLSVGNRKEVADLIIEGSVKVNNQVVNDLSFKPNYQDIIQVNNKEIKNIRTFPKIYLFHKPKGYLTTRVDPEGRPTIYEILPKKLANFITVGRLDFNTSGLLLLTNIGSIAEELESPDNGFTRIYKVKVRGELNMEKLESLRNGAIIDGIQYGKVIIKKLESNGIVHKLKVIIFEGKNREVRKILKHFRFFVVYLHRISYGPYQLNELPTGAVYESAVIHKSVYL